MRYKNIHNLVIEGPDGVGKSTLLKGILKKYNYMYAVYDRGEISNYIYAKKYNRPYYVTQNGLPFLYIVLLCDPIQLMQRINERAKKENWSKEALNEELTKINDSELFADAAKQMSTQFDIVTIDTTCLSPEEVLNEVDRILKERFESIPCDETLTKWNEKYKTACEMLGRDFKVIDNQPYIDGIPINVEATLHNGVYETFSDKSTPDNFIYALSYGKERIDCPKDTDFQYIINSKINKRAELYDYYKAFADAGKTCIVSNYETIPHYKGFERFDRIFGDEYLNIIARANATVYTARELEYLKLQTARLYEAIIARNIVFVDSLSDKDKEMLTQIHQNKELIDLLTVTPETIIGKYDTIMSDNNLKESILNNQHEYFTKLLKRNKR